MEDHNAKNRSRLGGLYRSLAAENDEVYPRLDDIAAVLAESDEEDSDSDDGDADDENLDDDSS